MIHYTARPHTRTEHHHHARRTAPARLAKINAAILATARRLAATTAELARLQAAALALARLDDSQ